MVILGLTGSIGTGKSTTAQFFRAFGIPVYDADKAVHQLYEKAAQTPIAQAFPDIIRDGIVDRAVLKAKIAQDPSLLTRLEHVIHPLVQGMELSFREKALRENHRLMVLDIPLLFETGGNARCDLVLVTHVHEAEQKKRVLARGGMNEADFLRLLSRQMPQEEKRHRAHICLDTGYGLENAKSEVAAIIRCLSGVIRQQISE